MTSRDLKYSFPELWDVCQNYRFVFEICIVPLMC